MDFLEKDVVAIRPEQMAVFAAWANHMNGLYIEIVCPKCETRLHGQNGLGDETFSVACKCREFRTTAPKIHIPKSDIH